MAPGRPASPTTRRFGGWAPGNSSPEPADQRVWSESAGRRVAWSLTCALASHCYSLLPSVASRSDTFGSCPGPRREAFDSTFVAPERGDFLRCRGARSGSRSRYPRAINCSCLPESEPSLAVTRFVRFDRVEGRGKGDRPGAGRRSAASGRQVQGSVTAAGAVSRAALIDTARSSGCSVIGITAPAGYGKSTLLARVGADRTSPGCLGLARSLRRRPGSAAGATRHGVRPYRPGRGSVARRRRGVRGVGLGASRAAARIDVRGEPQPVRRDTRRPARAAVTRLP